MDMETAQDMTTQLRDLMGQRVDTASGKVEVRADGEGFRVTLHEILIDGNQNTTFLVGGNGRVTQSETVKSAFEDISPSGQANFGSLSMGYFEPVVSEAKYSLRDVLRAVTDARKG
jgi:hypothetical protein